MAGRRPHRWGDLARDWPQLTAYQRFEAFVAAVLAIVIGVVILVALYRLIAGVIDALLLRALNPLAPQVFQTIFGEIMTLLIALEFNHTLQVAITERGIVQAKAIILIALLAVVRKVIIVELYLTTPAALAALAVLVVGLGVTYWLIRERDDRSLQSPPPPSPEPETPAPHREPA